MRGVISFLFVLAFLLPLMQLAALEKNSARSAGAAREDALFIQRKNSLELDVKNALRQALWSAAGTEREATAADAAMRLAALEPSLEKYCAEQGAACDVWLGIASESDAAAVLEETRARQTPTKCASCFDLATPALDSRGNPVLLAAALIDYDALTRAVTVSRNGLAFVPTAAPLFARGGEAGFGATIYFPERNAASIVMLPEGFRVEAS